MTDFEERLVEMLECSLAQTGRALRMLEKATEHKERAIVAGETLAEEVLFLREENQHLRELNTQAMRTIFEN